MTRPRTRAAAAIAAGALLTTVLTVPAQAVDPLGELVEHPLGGITPHSVAFSPAGSDHEGTLWLTDDVSGGLYQVDTDAPADAERIDLAPDAGPRGVTAGDDAIWVAGSGNDTLYKVVLGDDGAESAEVAELDLGELLGLGRPLQPSYIALSPDGETAWVTLTQADRILGISTSGELTAESVVAEYPTSADTLPTQIVVGGDGRLWFSQQSTLRHGVGAMDPETGAVSDFPLASGGVVAGIAAAGDRILATATSTGRVYDLELDGTVRGYLDLPSSSMPRAIAVGYDNTGAPATAWVVQQGLPGSAPAAVAQIDLHQWRLVAQLETSSAGGQFYNIAADPASSAFWGTARADHSLFSFEHRVVVSDQLTITGGDDGWTFGGELVTEPLSVAATVGGAAVEGATVTFAVEGTDAAWFDVDGEQRSAVTAVSDAAGTARVAADLVTDFVPEVTGFQVVATTYGAAPVTFTQTIGLRAAGIERVSPAAMSARVGSVVADTPRVRLQTSAATPLARTPVTFTLGGDDAVAFAGEPGATSWTGRTDENGYVTTPRLDAVAKGTSTITATTVAYPGGSAVFTAAVNGSPATIETASGVQGVAPGARGVFAATVLDTDGDPVVNEPVQVVIDPTGLPWVSLPAGSDVLTLITDGEGMVRFGAAGDGTDTFTVSPTAPPLEQFSVVLTTADPGAVSHHMRWQIDIGR